MNITRTNNAMFTPHKTNRIVFPPLLQMMQFTSMIRVRHESWSMKTTPCSWKGVLCDSTEKIAHIQWRDFQLVGNVSWSFIPMHTVSIMIIENSNLCGSLTTCVLPRTLLSINLIRNSFSGDIDSITYSPSLTLLDLRHNAFSESCSFETLPPSLKKLRVDHNDLSGEIFLETLPRELITFTASSCGFQHLGPMHRLPQHLRTLDISSNELNGVVTLTDLPDSLRSIRLHSNHLIITLHTYDMPRRLRFLTLNDNALVTVKGNFSQIPENLECFHLDSNATDENPSCRLPALKPRRQSC